MTSIPCSEYSLVTLCSFHPRSPSNPQEWEHREGLTISSINFTVVSTGQCWVRGTAISHTTRENIRWGAQPPGGTSECQTPPRKCECANHTAGTGGHTEKETSPPHSCQAGAFSLTPTFAFFLFYISFFFFRSFDYSLCTWSMSLKNAQMGSTSAWEGSHSFWKHAWFRSLGRKRNPVSDVYTYPTLSLLQKQTIKKANIPSSPRQ